VNPERSVELDIDIGADAKDWSAVQATEKLKPVETELRRIEELVQEIVNEMEYLRGREQKLRDTNESTNNRVKWFGFGTMGMLIALGAWQVIYLRAYFRYGLFFAADGAELTLLLDRSISSKHRHDIMILGCRIEERVHKTVLIVATVDVWETSSGGICDGARLTLI
jgi:hypothetical protein